MTADEPQCPLHGHMHFNFAADRWDRPGWDGEGCDFAVTAEDMEVLRAGPQRRAGIDRRGHC